MDQIVALAPARTSPFKLWDAAVPASPLILASPHSGREYREDFLAAARLEKFQLRRTEDAFVDLLFQDAPAHGVPLLCANFPRAWVDVNRDEWELDPAMFADRLPPQVALGSARVAVGLGAIPRVGAAGAPIYGRKLRLSEAEQRLEEGWRPYHSALSGLIERTRAKFGWCLLMDCHSMPSPSEQHRDRGAPDFVLGDLFGTSCAVELVSFCERRLKAAGFRVFRNTPYAGGYVTARYGRPKEGVHVLQLEVARRLYMDEAAIEPTEGFDRLRAACLSLVRDLVRRLAQP